MAKREKKEGKRILSLGQYRGLHIELDVPLAQDTKLSKIEGIVSTILENSVFAIDQAAVDQQVTSMIEQFKVQLAAVKMSLSEYLQQSEKDYDTFFDQLRVIALEGMKKEMVFAEIAARENISVTEGEITAKIGELARLAGKSATQMFTELQKRRQIGTVHRELLWEKITDFLLANNTFSYHQQLAEGHVH